MSDLQNPYQSPPPTDTVESGLQRIARWINAWSRRQTKITVAINCFVVGLIIQTSATIVIGALFPAPQRPLPSANAVPSNAPASKMRWKPLPSPKDSVNSIKLKTQFTQG